MAIHVEISPGELVDKLTILELKLERIADPAKLTNIRIEYDLLLTVCRAGVPPGAQLDALSRDLKEINGRLWTIEDDIRERERAQDFGPAFVALARSVYRTNDERAAVKRQISELMKSALIEEKSYTSY